MNSVIDFARIFIRMRLPHCPVAPATTVRLLRAAAFAFFVLVIPASASSVQPGQDQQAKHKPNHGPIELLKLEIVQSTDAADLLAIVDRQLELGNQETAFDALLALFETSDSDFINVDQQDGNASLYEQGISRLIESGFKTRREWAATLEPKAKVDLLAARHDHDLLRSVARNYPLTASGLTARLLLIHTMMSRGQVFVATAAIARLEQRYAGLSVPFTAQSQIDDAKRRIDHARRSLTRKDEIPGGLTSSDHESQLSSWQPVWRWKENVWNTPQIASAFSGLLQPAWRTDLVLNSWQPAISGNQLFLRTPTRLVCFDLSSGNEQWWVPTDTYAQELPQKFSEQDSARSAPRTTSESLRMNDLGTLSVCSDFIFFVDHYRDFQNDVSTDDDFGRAFHQANPRLASQESNAGRLVAIHRSDPPSVAWTVGSQNDFHYEFQPNTSQKSPASTSRLIFESDAKESQTDAASQTDADSAEGGRSFQGHRFLGPPLAFEQNLYVLTADHEMIWMNCLVKATGRLLYRRMMADIEILSQYSNQTFQPSTRSTGASLVGIHEGTLLCILNRGLVIGISLCDGRIQWATSLLSEDQQRQRPSARLLSNVESRPSFFPVLHDGHLICSAAESHETSCLNCRTGAIKWQIPRASDAAGQAEHSEDLLPAGIASGQLLVTGERHVRSICLADGSVNWTTAINGPVGKAVLAEQTCWIPTFSGMVVPVDLSTGRKGLPVQTPRLVNGSLFLGKNQIIAATPISVEVYPLWKQKASQRLPQDNRIQTNGHSPLIAKVLNSNQTPEQITDTLSHNSAQLAALTSDQQARLADRILSTDAPTNAISTLLENISPNVLTEEQKLRQSLLLDSRSPMQRSTAIVKLNSEWWVRADLAATQFHHPLAWAASDFSVDDIIRQPLAVQRQLLNQKGLTFSDLADRLLENRPEAAELALLHQISQEPLQPQREPLFQRLFNLRNSGFNDSQQPTAKQPTAKQDTTTQDRANQDTANLTESPFDRPLTFNVSEEFHLMLVRPMNQFPQLSREPVILQTHSADPGHRLFLQGRKLFAVNLHSGSVAKSTRLKGGVDQLRSSLTPLSPTTASLFPLVEQTHVGALSVIHPEKPKQLWSQRWDRADFDNSPLRSGPVTSSGIIFATNHRITCHHPLTGHLLWRRDFSMPAASRTALLGERFAADDQFLIALSSGYQSGTVFRMTDGKRLHTVKYDVPKGIRPVISECRLLYPKGEILKLVDLTSGTDLLGDSRLAIRPSSSAQLIDRHRAVILTANNEIAVLNLKTAQLETAVEIPLKLIPRNSTGFQAFEEHGRLFVSLRHWDEYDRRISATSAVGDRRMTTGILISIDPKTGENWSTRNPTSVLMEIAGDPSPLMLLWSRRSPESNRPMFRFNDPSHSASIALDTLVLRILDRRTGREVLRTDDLSWGNPLRCVHDSESRTITIETDASEIKLRYTQDQSKAK